MKRGLIPVPLFPLPLFPVSYQGTANSGRSSENNAADDKPRIPSGVRGLQSRVEGSETRGVEHFRNTGRLFDRFSRWLFPDEKGTWQPFFGLRQFRKRYSRPGNFHLSQIRQLVKSEMLDGLCILLKIKELSS
jgi:hypothetical protein